MYIYIHKNCLPMNLLENTNENLLAVSMDFCNINNDTMADYRISNIHASMKHEVRGRCEQRASQRHY